MIYINPQSQKVKEAVQHHYNFIGYVIRKKMLGRDYDVDKPDIRIKRINQVSVPNSIIEYLSQDINLRDVLIGSPERLDEIKDTFTLPLEIRALKLLFNYDNWVARESFYTYYHAYNLADRLNINTCVYCNRLYTKTVIKDESSAITRPEFDHWFPKARFPLLALSFYNLIPSCHVCNSSVKAGGDLTLLNHFHPYIDTETEINEQISFSYYNKSNNTYGFKIHSPTNSKGFNTVNAFKLEEIYKTHEDEIADLRKIRDTYSESYLEKLTTQFSGLPISKEEIYRLAFGVHMDEAMFEKRPLSKMKKDILIELGIIKRNAK